MTTAAPPVPQNIAALAEANRIRLHRAELKRDLKAGLIPLERVLEDPDAATWPIGNLLGYLPARTGRRLPAQAKVNRADALARQVLRDLSVSPARPAGRLTARERGLVVTSALALCPNLPR